MLNGYWWKNIINQSESGDSFKFIHSLQFCALVLRRVYNFSAWPGRRLERFNTHVSLAPFRYWLEFSKQAKHNLVPQRAPKLQDVKFSSFYFKHGHFVTLIPLEVQGRALPFWKPPINIFKEPDCHGCCSALNVCQVMLKNHILLYIRLWDFENSQLMQTYG